MPERKRVLVAEQAKTTRDTVAFLLSNRGYHVIPALTGREALSSAQTLQPDLIVLGAELPELSGYDVYRNLRLKASCRHIPVLLLVASTDSFDLPTRTLPDPEFLISKPFTAHDFLQRVGKALSETVRP